MGTKNAIHRMNRQMMRCLSLLRSRQDALSAELGHLDALQATSSPSSSRRVLSWFITLAFERRHASSHDLINQEDITSDHCAEKGEEKSVIRKKIIQASLVGDEIMDQLLRCAATVLKT